MKPLPHYIVTVLAAALVSFGVAKYATVSKTFNQTTIVNLHTLPEKIRCGYIVYPPYFLKDPNTGNFSGIFYDLTQKISEEVGIPVEWTVESGFGTAATDLQYKKFDVLCSGIWADPRRARTATFSIPANYAGILAYVRGDDTRYDNKSLPDLIKDKTLKVAVIDGEFSDIIRKSVFPDAKFLAEPQNSSVSQLAEDVQQGKADITFIERAVAHQYSQANPGKIKELSIAPLHIGETSWAFNKDDNDLRELFNTAIRKLNNDGYTERIMTKYEVVPNSYYRAAKPYEENLR